MRSEESVTGKRIAGAFIDLIPLIVLWVTMSAALGEFEIGSRSSTPEGESWSAISSSLDGWAFIHFVGLTLAYYSISEGMTGTTLGKWIMGLKVVRLDLRPYGWASVLIRNIFRVIDVLPVLYLLGIIAIGRSVHKQRVGDMVAGTLVARAGTDLEETSDAESSSQDILPVSTRVDSLGRRIAMAIAVVALISGVSIALSASAGGDPKAPAGAPMPSERSLEDLATDSLLELDRAIVTNDFSGLHSKVSELWKNEVTVVNYRRHSKQRSMLRSDGVSPSWHQYLTVLQVLMRTEFLLFPATTLRIR